MIQHLAIHVNLLVFTLAAGVEHGSGVVSKELAMKSRAVRSNLSLKEAELLEGIACEKC